MIVYIDPVPYIRSVSIDWQTALLNGIDDRQRNQLFREMKRAKIVGTVREKNREPKCPMPSPHQVIGSSLAGRVRRTRIIAGLLTKTPRLLERPKNFVCRYVKKSKSGSPIPVQMLPIYSRYLQKLKGPIYVGLQKVPRAIYGPVHMAFCREMNDGIRMEVYEGLPKRSRIANVGVDKVIARIVCDSAKGIQIACIS
jgi:hypothetical protein